MREVSIGGLIVQNSSSPVIENQKLIDAFFAPLSPEARQKWPFDFSAEGYATSYQQAVFLPPRDVLREPGEGMKISAVISNDHESFFMERGFYFFDDQLTVELKHLYRIGFGKPGNFAALAVRKFKDFIDAYDASRPDGKTDPSKLELEAVSNNDRSHTAALGGYVWANTGFEFKDADSRERLRHRFQLFAGSHGVGISDADMKYFTQPCHFAAFDCGRSVTDKFGHQSSLGKAFMLFESWNGIMYSGPNKGEAVAYAKMYGNPQTRSQAVRALSSGYRSLLNKYATRNKNVEEKKSFAIGRYMRQMSSKISKFCRF